MGEVTLKVPDAYQDAFRLAAVAEVRQCGEWVASSAEELSRHCVTSDEPSKVNPGDVRGAMKSLGEDVRILEQFLFGQELDEILGDEIKGDASALAHIAETMARNVIPPRIASAIKCGPFDKGTVEEVEPLTGALGWAAGEAARLHAVAGAECAAAKAVAA